MPKEKDLSVTERIFRGERMRFLNTSREEIKDFAYEEPYLIISVTDSEKPNAEILKSPNLVEILRLKFDDIGKPFKFQFNDSSDVLMKSEQARQILEFVERHINKVSLIVCQCEQGMSRSPAIAAALSKILQNEDKYFLENFWANRWVYELLIESSEDFDFAI